MLGVSTGILGLSPTDTPCVGSGHSSLGPLLITHSP
jgi:hypothetical protein